MYIRHLVQLTLICHGKTLYFQEAQTYMTVLKYVYTVKIAKIQRHFLLNYICNLAENVSVFLLFSRYIYSNHTIKQTLIQ